MPNINAPFGFRDVGRLSGSAPNFGMQTRTILNTSPAMFYGDPVQNNAGNVVVGTVGTQAIDGVFLGCQWYSISQNRVIHSNAWTAPGTDCLAGSATCLIQNDPFAVFLVQASAGPFTGADVDKTVAFTIGTGNSATGQSGATITSGSASSSLATQPFKIIQPAPPGNPIGGDQTQNFNWVYVTFNNQAYKSMTPF
jgi:hypothetical protein